MAFVTPTPVATHRSTSAPVSRRNPLRRPSSTRPSTSTSTSTSRRRTAPSATASLPRDPHSAPRQRASAPVVDSRVATRREAHHWLSVRAASQRTFERAAVAQADVTRQLERRARAGALHRWVLRELAPASPAATRYVVMESFARPAGPAAGGDADEAFRSVTRRWLSAVERVGPLVDAGDSRTLHYENVFTAKQHTAAFDPHVNVVALESHAVKDADAGSALDALRAAAEASVASGRCLEFCVLQSTNDPAFFKTVQVYRSADAMADQTQKLDNGLLRAVRAQTGRQEPTRVLFKPVVFA